MIKNIDVVTYSPLVRPKLYLARPIPISPPDFSRGLFIALMMGAVRIS
jgi:hypothetical protein